MKATAIIQARMSSSRMPGKVLAPLHDRPLLAFMIARLQACASLGHILVATSDDRSDDAIVDALADAPVTVVRGPLDDVLGRFLIADAQVGADIYVRLTADCPLIDPQLIDRLVAMVADDGADYSSNVDPPHYPDGLDCEAFTAAALRLAGREASLDSDREHVTPWMRRSAAFRRAALTETFDFSALRWTVDYPGDMERVRALVAGVAGDPLRAGFRDYLDAHRALDAVLAQSTHARNEGLAASLARDSAMAAKETRPHR